MTSNHRYINRLLGLLLGLFMPNRIASKVRLDIRSLAIQSHIVVLTSAP